ncbi:hypothetical protein [Siansivirga zeaxanthinifaciens]|uniref:Uncharacterized protein n=1 Tax=Siansivirga zeaxanthinifaciens CC-SAMT-1 TaxID=1454006 RepID=A0A0C5WFP9_9FLAO|nr:hypothetical protein [Siansivirga zeaxanthinifaciens]AJR04014.1 hypothetical protein AW14_10595 [Siansivirga zeaxanthinifaciens CC-SAMT-1]
MHKIREHIVIKILTLVLGALLLLPTATKFAHIFAHHKHDICKGEKTTHLHEINNDCDFYKFKLNNHYYFSIAYYTLFHETAIYKIPVITYKFLNNYRPLSFSLRGPPTLV